MKKLLLLLTIHYSILTIAQTPKTYTSSEILLNLKKLNVLGSVLYIAAHPDDENTRLLAYLANEKMVRTGYLSLTRGDGGQNLIGDEQGVDLGLIRTQELLAARRIDGAEQFFSRAYDFGFSKNPEEALRIWGHDKILSDVVWVIRKFKPDVIITRFPTTGEGGHGHHTASAILAGEAFEAAADATKFPEQFKEGVTVWQAKRLLWNTFNFGNTNTQNENQFKIDVGTYNPLLGKSYGEIAALSRSQHKSQGFGVPAQRGPSLEYFKTIKGDAPKNDLLDGINTSWNRTANDHVPDIIASGIKNNIEIIINEFKPEQPDKSVYDLVAVYKQIQAVTDVHWKEKKLAEVQNLIEQCSGLFMEATTNTQYAVQGDSLKINFSLNARSTDSASFIHTKLLRHYFIDHNDLQKNKNYNFTKTIFIKPDEPLTQPYWLREEKQEGSFTVNNQLEIGMPENDNNIVQFAVSINGYDFIFNKPLRYKYTDPVKGEIYQPFSVVPSLVIDNYSKTILRKEKKINEYTIQPTISFKTSKYINYKQISAYFEPKHEILKLPIMNSLVASNLTMNPEIVNYPSPSNNIEFTDSTLQRHTLSFEHIPAITYFSKAKINIVEFADNLKTIGTTIGYIPGAGDKIPEALEQMGYKVVTLKEADITTDNIKKLDAIVTGVRAYNTNEWMNNVYDVLMQYVKDGGTLLTQYNTSNNIGPVKAKIAPYPFTISRNRITDETAKVNFLLPNHPALNYPNKITAKDFEGWIQERSIYHAENIDSNYQRILSMADPDEKESDGSLIISNYGKGKFVYTGLVFFRELPAGVPGAYRLFANLLTPLNPPTGGTLESKPTQSSKRNKKNKS